MNERIRQACWTKPQRIVALVLLMLALLLGGYLWRAEKPWEKGAEVVEAAGKRPKPRHYRISGYWTAGAMNLGLFVLLGLSARYWMRPLALGQARSKGNGLRMNRLWLLALTGAVAVGAGERWSRMDQSLWNDEEYSLYRYVWGGYEREDRGDPESPLSYRPVTWEETLCFNRGANNHILFSITARMSLSVWAHCTRASEGEFAEWAYRMPSFVAGLGTLLLLGLLGHQLGAPGMGLVAAWIMAFHPWHIRYATEGRGYSLMLFFLLLSVMALLAAQQQGRWRWWLLFALSQALTLLAFPGALYAVAALGLFFGGHFLLQSNFVDRWPLLMRFGVAQVASAMLFLQIYAPSIPQVRTYLKRDIAQGTMGLAWVQDIWAHLVSGLQWTTGGMAGSHKGLGLSDLAAIDPLAFGFLAAGLPLLTVLGLIGAWRGGLARGGVVAVALVGPVLAFVHNNASGNFLFSWYLIFALPFLIMAWGSVPELLPIWGARGRFALQILGGFALVAFFAMGTRHARSVIQTIPRQPMRDAVELVRGKSWSSQPEIWTLVLGTSAGQILAYDPLAIEVRSAAELDALCERARSLGRSLYVYDSGREKLRATQPELAWRLERSGDFEEIANVQGLEEMFSYHVSRLRNVGDLR